ncbi:hypothetical protein Ac2012v2_000733 [Leucoagaricus gongylophorus]
MGLLAALVLRVLHFFYALSLLIHSFWSHQTRPSPQPLCTPRRRVPKNLALVFAGDKNLPRNVLEKTILQSCVNVVEWCQTLGISKLTIYEEHGLALELESQIRDRIPLTPLESHQLSPCHSTGHHALQPISLCLLSSSSSKTKIANLARSLYLDIRHNSRKGEQRAQVINDFSLEVNTVNTLLEANVDGFSSPDFMIIHPINLLPHNHAPFEFHGFPPWHMRLTEM